MQKFKVGETVKVVNGKYEGKIGEVLNFNKSTGYAVQMFNLRNSLGLAVNIVFPENYLEKQ